MTLYLLGSRDNPFNVYWHEPAEEIVKRQLQKLPKPVAVAAAPIVAPPAPPPPPPPPAKKPEPTNKPDAQPEPPARKPRPYEVPVDYSGWISVGGNLIAHFRDKESGQLIQARQGESIPDKDLTIVRVARTGVIVENGQGDRFLLREIADAGDQAGGGGADEGNDPTAKKPPPNARNAAAPKRNAQTAGRNARTANGQAGNARTTTNDRGGRGGAAAQSMSRRRPNANRK